MIDIVDYETAKGLERSMDSARGASPESEQERWRRFHAAVCDAAGAYGIVARAEGEAGDVLAAAPYDHVETDRLALRTLKLFDPSALLDLQRVVAGHHPNATLTLEGEPGTPPAGLFVVVTPAIVVVSWREATADECREQLMELGIDVEE